MFDVVIIGAGVIGASIARALSRYDLNIVVLEKENDIAMGTTKANSAIIHGGYDAKPGTMKAKMNALGNPMFDKICKELHVPFKRIGSYVLAFNEDEMTMIDELYKRGQANQIPGLEIHTKKEILLREPNINDDVMGGLFSKTAGIIGPWELTIGLAENAVMNGVDLRLNREVQAIHVLENGFSIVTNKESVQGRFIINAAGVYADKVHGMVEVPSYKIEAWKGQYYILDKIHEGFINTILFQCPSSLGKGVLILPTVHGNTLIGPDSEVDENKEDVSTDSDNLEFIRKKAMKTSEKLPMRDVITTFAGLRAKPTTRDFVIGPLKTVPHFYNVAGIESPGLSSAPAIAEHVVDWLKSKITLNENPNYNPKRPGIPHFMSLSYEEKTALIKEDSRYGNIVCRCEYITEGEIVASIKSVIGAKTVDGVKRRVRPGMGRCQGGFCGAKVMEILARELEIDIKDVVKDRESSVIVTGITKE